MIFMQPNTKASSRHPRAFTLVEVLVATALASVLLAAVMTAFMFLTKSGANLVHYSTMEHEAQRGLERFAQDVREASGIEWTSASEIKLVFESGTPVTYRLGGTDNTHFIRTQGTATTTLINGVGSLEFIGYNLAGVALSPTNKAVADKETKQLQLRLKSQRNVVSVAAATNRVLSARFILRNKQVTS